MRRHHELPYRLIKMALGLLLMTVLGFVLTPTIVGALEQPVPPSVQWTIVSPTDNPLTYLQVVIVTGVGLATPIFFWQAIGLVVPDLARREKRLLLSTTLLVDLAFLLGASIGYFVTLPFAIHSVLVLRPEFPFEVGFAAASIPISSYISVALTILFWTGVALELPVIAYDLARLRIVTARQIASYRGHAIPIFLLVAAITNPSPSAQSLAAPLVVYELAHLAAGTIWRRHRLLRLLATVGRYLALILLAISAVILLMLHPPIMMTVATVVPLIVFFEAGALIAEVIKPLTQESPSSVL